MNRLIQTEGPSAAALLGELGEDCRPRLMPLTAEQLHEMLRAGIVPDGSGIELIDGMLVYKDRSGAGADAMVHDPRHASILTRLVELLMPWARGIGYHVRAQLPVTLTAVNEPEPDVAVVLGPSAAFAGRHPGPEHVGAVFEVSDSSLRFDRTTKQRIYAAARIPTYWIVNLREGRIEVFTGPQPELGRFGEQRSYGPGDTIRLQIGQHALDVHAASLLA